MSGSILLTLDQVSKVYQSGFQGLKKVSLTVERGEFLAIIGQSGSGKSTLMNILGCLDRPTEGTYTIADQDVSQLDPDQLASLRRENFGFVFQRYNLLASSTAEENVELPAIYTGMPKAERLARANQLLSHLGLKNHHLHKPTELSGGQQQLVAIARALMNDPSVILADEPTGALDSRSGEHVMSLLKKLHEEGRTIIIITHNEHVATYAERVVTIRDGEIIARNENMTEKSHHLPFQKSAPKHTHEKNLMPEIIDAAKMALSQLKTNLFRTTLTLLGIIIGVASVITMLAIGEGSRHKVLASMAAMGTNLLSIRPGAPGLRFSGDSKVLTPEDADALAELNNVEIILPERSGRFTVRQGNLDYVTVVQGVGPGLPQVRDWPVSLGNFFIERDLKSYAPIAVLGDTVLKNLFPNDTNPLGKFILIRNVPFEVIGVLASKGATSGGTDQDDTIFIPLTTGLMRLFGGTYLNSITIKVADVTKIDATQNALTNLLIERHHTEDFRIRNSASILETASETQNTLTLLLAAIATISLLVGGIGVMNIMLVSVTERIREIGIRMATGARKRDIMLQFITEAAVVCTIGGVLGVMAGLLIGYIISLFNVAIYFSIFPALLAFSCAFFTGLLFGYLPAKKAAELDPVIALASE